MRDLLDFFAKMDARTARAFWISTGAVAVVGLALAIGAFTLNVDQGFVGALLRDLRGAWWAPAAVTAVFTLLAFIGAPQIALIAATVAVFGPSEGIVLSWTSTMISAVVGFFIGRLTGAQGLSRLGGDLVRRVAGTVKDNGFLAALVIRMVPSGPFILVNMALGATGMRLSWFAGGTGVGIVPKIVLVAFAGHGLGELFSGRNAGALMFLAAAAVVWLAIVFIARPLVRRWRP
ncbi:MAG: TVP38/TMEM64 family protein [Caulobacterales bacterium]